MSVINLFKHRNLALGCSAFLIMLYTCFYVSGTAMLLIGSSFIVTTLICLILYLKRNSVFCLNVLIKITCVTLFVSLAIIISVFTFQKDKEIYEFCDGSIYEIEGTVDDVLFNQEYFAGYSITVNKINGESCNFKSTVTDESASMKRNDVFKATVVFSPLKNSSVGFDTANYYLDSGILTDGEIIEYLEISEGKSNFIDTLRGINEFLDEIIKDNFSERTYPVISALLLGNRDLLSRDTNRDFARLGIVHILSLSGMHVSIIVTIIGFALSKSPLSSTTQFLLISFIIVLFVGISGFSEPAIRAGLMQLLFHLAYICWSVPDKITTLFVSVTLICLFDPYLIFSIGLSLSFLAMLGCMLSAKLIYRTKIIYKFKGKFLRFCFLTFCTTTAVTFLCLPFTYIYFGSVSVVSCIANIILVPIINVIIYLVPLILLLLPIRFISDVLIYFCQIVCDFVLDLCVYFADAKNLLLPIKTTPQLIGTVLLFCSVLLLFILPRKKLKISLYVLAASFVIFSIGTIVLFVNRNNSTYITSYSYSKNDVICVEENNALTVIDISNHSKSSVFSRDMSVYLGYGEISRYVILTYNSKSAAYFDKMTGEVVIRHIFLAKPQNDTEEKYYNECIKILDGKNISHTTFVNKFDLGSFKFDMNEDLYIDRSTKRCVVFSLTKDKFKYSYFSASSSEVNSKESIKRAFESDVLVFGAFGPNYKTNYQYKMPNMEYCVFLDGSEEYANGDFYNSIENKFVSRVPFKVRIDN